MNRQDNTGAGPLSASTARLRSLALLACALGALALGACGKSQGDGEDKSAAAAETKEKADAGVTLAPEQIEKLGIVTEAAGAAEFTQERTGYGVVLAHETIAQAVAEVATADAALQQSKAALARIQRLSTTPGAFSAESLESAQRQELADSAALSLAQRRLSATVGQRPAWTGKASQGALSELASGQIKLVRVTFPLGTVSGTPDTLRLTRLDAGGEAQAWKTKAVWPAPADAAIPGRSFFTLLDEGDVGEGERLQVSAASGATQTGVLVPAAAVVISEGKYWCYVEKPEKTFLRIGIDTSRPVEKGYVVTEGVAVGDRLVTASAGLLLAREINPETEAE